MSGAELIVVLAQVPEPERSLSARERVAAYSTRAREALGRAAALSGAELGTLEKDANDAPLPSNGWHWSLAHSGGLVAGVVARQAVGVDLERVRTRRPELVAAVLHGEERALLAGDHGFVRGWTAKEAVLKKLGVGLTELSRCRILAAPRADVLELEHDGRAHRVHLIQLESALAAVSVDGPDRRVRWERTDLEEAQA